MLNSYWRTGTIMQNMAVQHYGKNISLRKKYQYKQMKKKIFKKQLKKEQNYKVSTVECKPTN